jgi:hypothetical protein
VAAASLFVIVDLVTTNIAAGCLSRRARCCFFCHRRGGKASLHRRKNLERDTTVLKEFIARVHASRLGAIRRVEAMHRIALPATELFRIPPNRVIEFGG